MLSKRKYAALAISTSMLLVKVAGAQEVFAPSSIAESTSTTSEWSTTVHGVISAGDGVRTGTQSSLLKPGGSNNSDDGDLNYKKGDTFSRPVTGFMSMDIKNSAGYGFVVSGMGWYDYSLLHDSVSQGNNPSNYVPGPLSDKGFASQARFQGAELLSTYAYGTQLTDAGKISWRLGRIELDPLTQFSFSGGLRDLEIRNSAASGRPGAQPEESAIPFWGSAIKMDVTNALSLKGFWQFAPEHSVQPGCGTMLASNDYSQNGCNRVFYYPALTQEQQTAKGIFIPRGKDINPDNRPDQFGLGLSYLVKPVATIFSAYYAHYDSRDPYSGTLKGNGLGPKAGSEYVIQYPGDKNLFDLSSLTKFKSINLAWSNEVSLITGQPLQLNTTDLLAAGLGAGGPLGAALSATPINSLFKGYDRYDVLQVQSGLLKSFDNVLGANKITMAAEVSLKHVIGLPDSSVTPYGRPESGQVCANPAACADGQGLVTTNAWAYRLRFGADYLNPIPGVIKLHPSIAVGQDVSGWSYDYSFNQGRKIAHFALDADFMHGVFANLTYARNWGGQFNIFSDRSYVMASIGKRF